MENSKNVLNRSVGSANADLDTHARLELGSELQIDRVLAERPGALTYLAHELGRRRPVVLRARDKKALEAAGLLDDLHASLAEVAALEHETIVPVYGFGVTENTVWWTTQFLHAQSLDDLVRTEGRLPLERTIRMARRVAKALLHAHDRGVAHGDVSPSNLLIRNADWVVVKDFVRPEAWLPNVARIETAKRSPSADQRGLAITIYRCLVGDADRPTAGLATELGSTATLTARLPDLAPSVVAALVRGADSDSSRQFGSVVELVAALEAPPIPNGAPKPTSTPSVVLPEEKSSPKLAKAPEGRRLLLGALAVFTIVFAGLAFARWLGSVGDRGAPSQLASRDIPAVPAPRPAAPEVAPPAAATPPEADSIGSAREIDSSALSSQADSAVMPAKADSLSSPPERDTLTPPPEPTAPPPSPPRRIAKPVTPTRVEPSAGRASARSARLSIRSVPRGTLYIDNRLIGPTPRYRLSLPPGTHIIRITRPGYRRFLAMVDLAAGEDRRLTNLVLQRQR